MTCQILGIMIAPKITQSPGFKVKLGFSDSQTVIQKTIYQTCSNTSWIYEVYYIRI